MNNQTQWENMCMTYRTGMAGSVRVNSKRDGSTLLAIAYVSWKSTFTSCNVKVLNRSL